MPKYIAILGTKNPFTPQHYRAAYQYFGSSKSGMHFREGVLAFQRDDPIDLVRRQICLLIEEGDELSLFEISNAASRLSDDQRSEQFRAFFDTTPG